MTTRTCILTAAAACAALAAPAPARQPPARPAGADVVPSTAFAFVTVKVSDLWDAESLKPAREVLAKADAPLPTRELERAIGIAPAEVERVTLFWPAVMPGPVEPATFVVLTTRKPYNEAKVLKALRAVPIGERPARRNVWVAPTPAVKEASSPPPPVKKDESDQRDGAPEDQPAAAKQPAEQGDDGSAEAPELFGIQDGGVFGAVFLLDDRTLLFLPVRSLRDDAGVGLVSLVGQLLRRKADGPLADALALADKHTVVAAVRLAQADAAFSRGPEPYPREVVPFRSLLKARSLTLTADVGADAKLSARFAFADPAAARRAEPVLKTLLQFLGEPVAAAREEVRRDEERAAVFLPLIDLVAQALEKAEVKADGAAVTARVSVELGPAVTKAMAGAPRSIEALSSRNKSLNNLKQIGLAHHNHHDVTGHLPTDILDPKTGKPILSWRVQILPYIEQTQLYNQIDLTKPWDDPRNKKFLEQMPDVFRVYGREAKGKGLTYLQMPSSDRPLPGGSPIKVPGRKRRITDITDGSSNTLLVVEAADPVPWMKPDDLPFDGKAVPKLGSPDRNRFLALFGDGSVRELKRDKLTDDQLRAVLTADGGEVIGIGDQ